MFRKSREERRTVGPEMVGYGSGRRTFGPGPSPSRLSYVVCVLNITQRKVGRTWEEKGQQRVTKVSRRFDGSRSGTPSSGLRVQLGKGVDRWDDPKFDVVNGRKEG